MRNNDLLQKHYGDCLARLQEATGAEAATYALPTPPEPEVLPEPGALPPGSWMVFGRNHYFTGRKDALVRLGKLLLHEEAPSTPVTQAVAGIGSVEKRQLAVEFLYHY